MMGFAITVYLVDDQSIRRVANATSVHVDCCRDSAPDFKILAAETSNPLTGMTAWERQGLLTEQRKQGSVLRLVGAAARWATAEAEKPQ